MPYVFGAEESGPRERGRLRHRGRRRAARRARRIPPPTEVDRQVADADRGRDRGRRLPADRHRRHAERRLRPAPGRRRARPRHPHRDARRRHDRPGRGRHRDRRAKDAEPVTRSVFTFALGSRRQYDFIDRNPRVQCCPVDYTNLPHNIMQNDRVVSINNTTQIDLQGQAASESDGHRHLTGTGGQLQFVRGAYASRGGKSFICLSSTYERQRRAEEPDRRDAHARQRRHHAAHRRHVRRHRVRDGEPEGQVASPSARRR